MRYFQNFALMFEKRDAYAPQPLSPRFVCAPYNCLKNLFTAVNATRSATRMLLRGRGVESKVVCFFFAQKLPTLGHVLNKPQQLKRITEGAWMRSPQPLGDFRGFAKNIAILTQFQSHFARF